MKILMNIAMTTNVKSIIAKLIFSMLVSMLMVVLTMMDFTNGRVSLFIFFTILNYISVDTVLNIFSTSVTGFYDKLINDLYNIEKEHVHTMGMTFEKKEILQHKFIRVKQHFVKGVLSLQFLRTNDYDKSLEVSSLKKIAAQTVDLYLRDMRDSNVTESFITSFNDIHDPYTEIFMNNIIESIMNDELTWERRKVLYDELLNLMKQSVSDFVDATDCSDMEIFDDSK